MYSSLPLLTRFHNRLHESSCGFSAIWVRGSISSNRDHYSKSLDRHSLVWPIGSIIGFQYSLQLFRCLSHRSLFRPLIGGSFSSPASQFSIFKQTIFDRHPYFLPCFVAGLLSIVGFTLAYFCLGEVRICVASLQLANLSLKDFVHKTTIQRRKRLRSHILHFRTQHGLP